MPKRRPFANPFELPGGWYKANLHTHTTNSDGRLSPVDRVKQYRQAGYHVLALTDHGKVTDTRGLSDSKILVMRGIETHPSCPNHPSGYHLVGLNVPTKFTWKGKSAQSFIHKVRQRGGETILAHPFWCGHQLENFCDLKGLAALEVYNQTCYKCARGSSESEWAHALDRGLYLPMVAVDDTHLEEFDPFGAWSMLKMRSLTAANVLKAIRTGASYASCGPTIHDFRVVGEEVHLRCSPVVSILFASLPAMGAFRLAKPGKTVTGLTAKATQDWTGKKLPFIRARVTDAHGRMAWTNPIFLR